MQWFGLLLTISIWYCVVFTLILFFFSGFRVHLSGSYSVYLFRNYVIIEMFKIEVSDKMLNKIQCWNERNRFQPMCLCERKKTALIKRNIGSKCETVCDIRIFKCNPNILTHFRLLFWFACSRWPHQHPFSGDINSECECYSDNSVI